MAKSKVTFLKLVEDVLAKAKGPLTAEQIWEQAGKLGLQDKLGSKGKTPITSISSLIYVDLKYEETKFAKVGARPTKFALKDYADKKSTEESESTPTYKESDLHAFLSFFAHVRLGMYTKTINHKTSTGQNAGVQQWIHPDMVGASFHFDIRGKKVSKLMGSTGSSRVNITSFELKTHLSFKNIRPSYFQAVSNSSWAHQGFLVAAQIDSSDDFQLELQRLTGSFGIGIIEIDVEDPLASKIIFPSRIREELDWEAIEKIMDAKNKDFGEFLDAINDDLRDERIGDKYIKVDPNLPPTISKKKAAAENKETKAAKSAKSKKAIA